MLKEIVQNQLLVCNCDKTTIGNRIFFRQIFAWGCTAVMGVVASPGGQLLGVFVPRIVHHGMTNSPTKWMAPKVPSGRSAQATIALTLADARCDVNLVFSNGKFTIGMPENA